MISLKKYKRPKIEIVLIENDIITESNNIGGETGPGGSDPWDGENSAISRMNPLDRPLGIFKRN